MAAQVDERKLTELFADAAPDAPPPSFDYDDVAAESGRQRVRRRNALLGGSALGIALLAGATVLGVALWKGADAGEANSTAGTAFAGGSGNAEVAPSEVPSEDARQSSPKAASGAQDNSFPPEVPKQGGPPSGNAGTQEPGSTSSGCGQADGELAAALAGELPSAALADRLPADIPCAAGSRGVAFRVSGGIVSLVVSLKDAEVPSPVAGQPENTAVREAVTADGRRVLLVSEPDVGGADPPYENDLHGIVDRLKDEV